jgi:K+-sensing histidine kinase KdpD
MDFQLIIAVRCREDGSVIEVLQDDLGLAALFRAGTSLRSIVEPGSVPAAEQFVREIRENGVALEIGLAIRSADASASLFIAGCRTQSGIHLIGTRESLTRETLLRELASLSNGAGESGLTPDALLALTAHDVRNHLNGILAATQYLLDDAAMLLEPEHVTLLRSIESSGRDMFRVIDDVMQVSLLESSATVLDIQPTDVIALVRKTLSSNRSLAERKKVRLELAPATAVPPVAADPARIERVINSLLASITDSTASGGNVEVSFAAKEQQVLLFVRVENSSMSPEQVRAVFDVAYPSMEGVKPGTVLAFRVISRIVEEHGGSLEVESATEAGFTIRLALPISAGTRMRYHGV